MHCDRPRFGVAGFPPNFFKSIYKNKREHIFKWLAELKLDWVELQCTYGIRMPHAQAIRYKELASEYDIGISIHAPYYITLASASNEVVRRSQETLKSAFELAATINSERIIFHPGHFPGSSDKDRKTGLLKLIKGLNELKQDLPIEKGIKVYPEIAGRIGQLGSFEEVLDICEQVTFARPCLDLAHLHAREGGSLRSKADIMGVFSRLERRLGKESLASCHVHMYPVGINSAGENGHKAFGEKCSEPQRDLFTEYSEQDYCPQASPFVEAILELGVNPVVICEAKDTQDEGALLMRNFYRTSVHHDHIF